VVDYDVVSALSISIVFSILYLDAMMFTTRKKHVESVQAFCTSDLFKFAFKVNLKSERKDDLLGSP
jgi:hypothetical protein